MDFAGIVAASRDRGRRLWRDGSARLLDWLLPERCRSCDAPGAALCAACLGDWPRLPEDRCAYCALPVAANGDCPVCALEAPAWDYCFTPFVYDTPLDTAISAWKFGDRLDWTRPLAAAWVAAMGSQPPSRPACLIPVPLHRARLRERGFNQSELLARHWGRSYHIPVRAHVQRQRNTPHQVGMSKAARLGNLRGAFCLRGRPPTHVAIVDDVLTTGSTLQEIAQVLRAAGVERIDAWILARAT
ncbi:MAG: ComF family protein [Acidithiobacillus sp.]|uniref:ComF family protein n=1 Tax=Acidithiobacillus sp. TaxID=1872118 RepID=UPI003D04321F